MQNQFVVYDRHHGVYRLAQWHTGVTYHHVGTHATLSDATKAVKHRYSPGSHEVAGVVRMYPNGDQKPAYMVTQIDGVLEVHDCPQPFAESSPEVATRKIELHVSRRYADNVDTAIKEAEELNRKYCGEIFDYTFRNEGQYKGTLAFAKPEAGIEIVAVAGDKADRLSPYEQAKIAYMLRQEMRDGEPPTLTVRADAAGFTTQGGAWALPTGVPTSHEELYRYNWR